MKNEKNINKVEDPHKESTEFCLDCFNKHSGHATVLIGEALDRIRQNPDHDDPKTVEFIRLHANKAMNELAAAEDHVKYAKTDSPEIKEKLDGLAHEARIIRDQIRTYLKTAPNPKASNFKTIVENHKKKEQPIRIDLLRNALTEASELRNEADVLSSEIGCGDCLASKEDLEKVEQALSELSGLPIKKEIRPMQEVAARKTEIKEEINETKTIQNKDDLRSLFALDIPTLDDLAEDFKANFRTEVIDKQVRRVKQEVVSVPFQFINDIVTALFGNPVKKKNK